MPPERYIRPSRKVLFMNRYISVLTYLGISVHDSRILTVRGRKSGIPRKVPVSLIVHDGQHYLSAGRGETEWVRNLRAAGEGDLRLGPRNRHFTISELANAEKPPVLRTYLARHIDRIGPLFSPATPTASDEVWAAVAPNHPVFRLEYRQRA
jgi:deazaflavin-dependent oxidoreductase (nitroreductase family)